MILLLIQACLQGNVSYYCLNRGNGNGTTPNSCAEATQSDIDLLTSSMAACFKTAVSAGVNIAISPHLDDGLGLGNLHSNMCELNMKMLSENPPLREVHHEDLDGLFKKLSLCLTFLYLE